MDIILIFKNYCFLKISGSKASAWLGLESDSDEGYDQMSDGDDGENDQLVTVKPHFEGKAGQEVICIARPYFKNTLHIQDIQCFRESFLLYMYVLVSFTSISEMYYFMG